MTLPEAFAVRLALGVERAAGGRVLIGGSPVRALRLSAAAANLLRDDRLVVTGPATAQLADRLLDGNLAMPDLSALAPEPADRLTVVIPVRDRPAQLDRTLSALVGLPCVVVDDASHGRDAVHRVVRRHGARLVPLQENAGPAGARNAGLAVVTTPFVAFVDSDVEVRPAGLLALTRHFADPAVALVGPLVTGRSRTETPRWFERYDADASSLSLGRRGCTVRPGAAVAWLPSACLVARTAALGSGFAADLRVGEDVDLVWRLLSEGHRVRYDPDVEAFHDTRSTAREWLGRKAFYGAGGAVLGARHGDKVAPAVLSPTSAAAAAALLVARPWAPLATVVALARMTWSVRGALPQTLATERTPAAARLSVRGLTWALRQESALVVRHWWPAAAVAALSSRRARRVVATALAVDTVAAVLEHRERRRHTSLPWFLLGRRLDDLAYGAGLWWGAARQRSAVALTPRWRP